MISDTGTVTPLKGCNHKGSTNSWRANLTLDMRSLFEYLLSTKALIADIVGSENNEFNFDALDSICNYGTIFRTHLYRLCSLC